MKHFDSSSHAVPADTPPDTLLAAYYAGAATPAECAEVEVWASGSPERREWLEAGHQAWRASARTAESSFDPDQFVTTLMRRVSDSPRTTSRPRRLIGIRYGLVLGVAVLMVASILTGIRREIGSNSQSMRVAPSHRTQYATRVGQRATLTLHDGTRVTLAPQTTLTVDPSFGATTRTVILQGEAYFDVNTATAIPFRVRTGIVTTRVLGTAFTVQHYRDDAHVRVAVAAGKVLVSAQTLRRPSVILPAGTLGVITDSTATTTRGDPAQFTAWTRGQLVFDEAPTTEVLAMLTRWYGYQFKLADSTLARRNLTAVLDGQSAPDALRTIKLLLDVDLTFDGTVVTLHPRHGDAQARTSVRERRELLPLPTLEAGR